MSPKKRVYDLAKDYGMAGKELVVKLQELGFARIKSPMAALDDFQVLEIQGRLEANGIVPESSSAGDRGSGDGLIVRRKKKKKKVAPATTTPPAPVAPPPPAPAPVEATSEEPPAALEPEVEVRPAAPEEVASEPAATETGGLEPPGGPTGEPIGEPSAEVTEAEPAPSEAPAPAQEETAGEEGSETTKDGDGAPEATDEGSAADETKPGKRGPGGKVVGFVDLSQFAAPAPRKSESRRLRSRDDVAPDVQPTLGHDRRRAFMRGDQASRGRLTAAQLREKEASRFLRRRGMAQQQRGPRAPRRGDPNASPHAGGEVKVASPVTIKKLAEALAIKANQLLGKAFALMGPGVNINSALDEDSAVLLSNEFDVQIKVVHEVAAETALLEELGRKRTEVQDDEFESRPPIVAFLGHVDHGKTTLLDTIRSSRVVHGETGGITQHLGAYQVQTKSGHKLTIIDTPGHEAFSRMRVRGAQAVDIAVLVVAADDGVMPSTIEAIAHARAAKTPIVVALNKMDKPEANADKVLQQLANEGLQAEDWGGDTAVMRLSALKGDGVDELLERVFLEGDVLELKSHSEGAATGVVLEAEVQEGKGRVAHLLVQDGTLNQGDIILAGEGYGRVRSMHDDRNRSTEQASPSTPVAVSGLSELPTVGDKFYVVERLEQAREVAEERAKKNRAEQVPEQRQLATVDTLDEKVAEQARETINVVLKTDVQGSLEAIKQQLEGLVHEEVEVRLIHGALGTITESDVNLAAYSDGMVIGFHVGANGKARQAADRNGVEIRRYDVIYELLDELRAAMEGTLAPELNEEITGHIEVRHVFKSSRFGNIAGSFVLDGTIHRNCRMRVTRAEKVIHEGEIGSLRRIKDDVKEVNKGFECGVVLKNYDDYEEGDILEAYRMVAVKRLLKI